MFEDEDPRSWKHDPRATGLILLFILLSPLGGAVMGPAILMACDIPWEGSYQCIIPDPVISYFMISWLGPMFLLGTFGWAWMLFSFVLTTGFACLFVRASWEEFADWW
jgi:hypothetical protein